MKKKDQESVYHRELETILRFGALVNSSLNIEDVLDHAMKWALDFMEAEASSIYEVDEEKNELFIRLARGEKKDPLKGITMKLGEGIAGHVVQSGTPMVIQDVTNENRFSDKYDKFTGFKTRSLICVPLILREKSIGAIQVLNKKSKDPFNDADLELLTGMAQQVAVAMENAKLYQRLKNKFALTASELKITQNKLIRSERLAAIGHLVQGVAHEIRNPIMTIGGFASRIKKESANENKVHKYVEIILDESERLEKLVKQVRNFSDVQSASLIPDQIGPVINETIKGFESIAAKQGISIIKEIPDETLRIKMDAHQLSIAIANIIENALEAMTTGGMLTIIQTRRDNFVLITVSDDGAGISPDQLDSVYDPFVTSKTRGAGLGLTMVHRIIMNHHGEISINSEQNKGTRITIQLPIYSG